MAGGATSGQYYDFRADTPESTRAKRKMIDAMLEEAVKYKPLGHWSAALAQGFQGLMGGMGVYNLQQEEKAAREAAAGDIKKLGDPDIADPALRMTTPDTAGGASIPVKTPPAVLTPPAPRAAPTQPAPRVQSAQPADTEPEPVGYDYAGPTVNGDRAYGRYGVMGAQVPTYTKEVFGREMTPGDFLTNPQAQDAIAKHLGLNPVPAQMAAEVAGAPVAQNQSGAAPMPASAAAASELPKPAAPALGAIPTAEAVGAEGAKRAPAPPSPAEYLSRAVNESPRMQLLWSIARSTTAPPNVVKEAWDIVNARAQELRKADTPLTQEELTDRAQKQASAKKEILGAEKERLEVLKSRSPSETAEAATKLLTQARQLPVDFGRGAFERGTGTYIGNERPIWENFSGAVASQLATGFSELSAAIKGGARPGEIQDAVRGIQADLVATLGPMMRGPGAQSDYEVKQLEQAVGALGKATSVEDYNRRLDRLEKQIESLITRHGDPVKIMRTMAGPRSANAPESMEGAAERLRAEESAKASGTAAGVRALLPPSLGGYPAATAPVEPPGPAYINRARKGDMDERRAALRRAMAGQ